MMSIRTSSRSGSTQTQSRPRKPARETRVATRRRRTPEQARTEALDSARKLLLDEGPNAVTLQRVAADIGMTHSNLLHHFGSARELQADLMAHMVEGLTGALREAVTHLRAIDAPQRTLVETQRALVEMVFDAFDKGGAGRLAAWLALTGKASHLDAIQSAIDSLVKAMSDKFGGKVEDTRMGVTSAVLLVALMAFGDAIIGDSLKDMLKREQAAPRKLVAFLLTLFLDPTLRAKLP